MKYLVLYCFCVTQLVAAQAIDTVFPESYFGLYKGELLIDNPAGRQQIGMEFQISESCLRLGNNLPV